MVPHVPRSEKIKDNGWLKVTGKDVAAYINGHADLPTGLDSLRPHGTT